MPKNLSLQSTRPLLAESHPSLPAPTISTQARICWITSTWLTGPGGWASVLARLYCSQTSYPNKSISYKKTNKKKKHPTQVPYTRAITHWVIPEVDIFGKNSRKTQGCRCPLPDSALFSRKCGWLTHSQADSELETSNFVWPTPILATSGDQQPGTASIRLFVLVSQVQAHNVLSTSRGLDFPSSLMSVSSPWKRPAPSKIAEFISKSDPSLDLPCWPWICHFKRC